MMSPAMRIIYNYNPSLHPAFPMKHRLKWWEKISDSWPDFNHVSSLPHPRPAASTAGQLGFFTMCTKQSFKGKDLPTKSRRRVYLSFGTCSWWTPKFAEFSMIHLGYFNNHGHDQRKVIQANDTKIILICQMSEIFRKSYRNLNWNQKAIALVCLKKNYKTGSTPRRPHASWKHRTMWPDACDFVAAGDIEHGDL